VKKITGNKNKFYNNKKCEMERILVINNRDSFVYNLVGILENKCNPIVINEDDIYEGIEDDYDKIVLSPGAGLPSEYTKMMNLIKRCSNNKSILGVCLGHQAIIKSFGGELMQMDFPKHGHKSILNVLDKNDRLLHGLNEESCIGRYHSWVACPNKIPLCFNITALDEDNNIMAISHNSLRLYGLQFHPESIISNCGETIIDNWLKI